MSSPFCVPYPMAYLAIKRKEELIKTRERYSKGIGPFRTEHSLAEIQHIITMRFTLMLCILGATPKADHVRYSASKWTELIQEFETPFGKPASKWDLIPLDTPSLVAAWSIPLEHVQNVEELLPWFEELLVHDAAEQACLKKMSKSYTGADWTWWLGKRPFFNIQKACRAALNSGIKMDCYPMPIKEWVMDKTMLYKHTE